MPSTGYNYLSKEKQLAGLMKFRAVIEQELKNEINSNLVLFEPHRSIEDLKKLLSEGKLTKEQCIFTWKEHFKKLSDDTNETISNRVVEDTKILLEYLRSVEQLLVAFNQLINTLEPLKQPSLFNKSSGLSHFQTMLKLCREQYYYLERAIDINIYRVVIPRQHYSSIFSQSDSFNYEGRATATAKVVGASIFFIPAQFITSIAYMLSILGGERGYKIAETIDSYTSDKCVQGAWTITHYGYGCQRSILPEWIQGLVKPDLIQVNRSFNKVEEPCDVIYVLDARNPKTVFEEGINYTKMGTDLNPLGKVIFFKEFDKACQCAELRHDGAFYDAIAGWRLYNKWEEEELATIHDACKLKEASTSSANPPEPAVLDSEYIGFLSSRP